MTRLILIRHGATEWNVRGRYCGRRDIGLSRDGLTQAKRLGDRLKTANFDSIYCSPKKRALQTCRAVFGRVRAKKVDALKEIDFGAIEGLRHSEISARYPDVYGKWLEDPFRNNIPGAEKMSSFRKRVESAVRRIAALNSSKTAVIVCHGGVIGIVVCGIKKSRNFWRHVPSSASMTTVEYKNKKFKIRKFNDIAHLR